MKRLLISAAVASLFCSAVAFAGPGGTSCATAEVLGASSTVSGNTSSAGYVNGTSSFGATPSPAADSYYKFVANNVGTGETISFTSQYNAGIALTSDCGNNSTAQQAVAANSTTTTLPLKNGDNSALTNGSTYYIIVTGSPLGTSADVGAYNFTTPTPLPVKLQTFSVQ